MCSKAVEKYLSNLAYVSDYLKTQKTCDDSVRRDPYSLKHVPDLFVTREWIDMWHDDYYDDDGNRCWCDCYDKVFEWHESYQKRKAQKAQIKEKLLPIAWHPLRYWDWCMSEDKKRETEKL